MQQLELLEVAKIIDEFPNYEVTNFGRVFNIITGREMILSPTQQGDLTVGLTRDGHQYRRSVKVLVARAFVQGEDEIFNTPVQLDGNKENLFEENIVWRPRWFACEYARQFVNPPSWYYAGPIRGLVYGFHYRTIIQASVKHGILCREIYESITTAHRVFPIGEIFVLNR